MFDHKKIAGSVGCAPKQEKASSRSKALQSVYQPGRTSANN